MELKVKKNHRKEWGKHKNMAIVAYTIPSQICLEMDALAKDFGVTKSKMAELAFESFLKEQIRIKSEDIRKELPKGFTLG